MTGAPPAAGEQSVLPVLHVGNIMYGDIRGDARLDFTVIGSAQEGCTETADPWPEGMTPFSR